MIHHYHVVVIGAGASGLFCAIEAAKRGRTVLVLDHESLAGRKIFVSGGGHCNFTNRYLHPACYLSNNPHFCVSALKRFSQDDTIQFMQMHHIAYQEKTEGRLFCEGPAQNVIRALLNDCQHYGVHLRFSANIQHIRKAENFEITTHHDALTAASLVIATGGLSYVTLGASSLGYRIAKQFNLNVITPRPALVPLTFNPDQQDFFRSLAGISFQAKVSVKHQAFCDQLLFTHQGLSGPAILQISSYWKENEPLQIDTLPHINLVDYLKTQRAISSKKLLKTYLIELLPKRFIQRYLEDRFRIDQPLNLCSDHMIKNIADYLHHWNVSPISTLGYESAEVTLGGVDTQELSSKTFETKKVKGLYFIGEVIDVTGQLGGYNLQWAWSSGFCAGQFV